MTANEVIKEIKKLAPGEQLRVIQFAVELARSRRLVGNELSALAQRMVESEDLAEVEKNKIRPCPRFLWQLGLLRVRAKSRGSH